MTKKPRNINHLKDLITGTIQQDRLDDLKFYLSTCSHSNLENIKKQPSLLMFAVHSGNLEICKYLYSNGFSLLHGPSYILVSATYDKLVSSFNILKSLDNNIFEKSGGDEKVKELILSKILEQYKVIDNPNRESYAIDLMKSGFIDEKKFNKIFNKIQEKNKGTRFEKTLVMVNRELILNQLL